MVLLRTRNIASLILALAAAFWIFLRLNPANLDSSINRLFIINSTGVSIVPPLTIEQTGDEFSWRDQYDQGIDNLDDSPTEIAIRHPFLYGHFMVLDGYANVVCDLRVAPTGRFGRRMTIRLQPDGIAMHAFDNHPLR